MYLCFIALAIGVGYATFVENDFGTATARVAFYDASWFEILLLLTTINLLLIIYKTKMYRRKAQFLFHILFLLILFFSFSHIFLFF